MATASFTGTCQGLNINFSTGKQNLTLEVNEDARDTFEEMKGCKKLDIRIKKHREKRSLDAIEDEVTIVFGKNAFFAERIGHGGPRFLLVYAEAEPAMM